jgi:hypothetical protein
MTLELIKSTKNISKITWNCHLIFVTHTHTHTHTHLPKQPHPPSFVEIGKGNLFYLHLLHSSSLIFASKAESCYFFQGFGLVMCGRA